MQENLYLNTLIAKAKPLYKTIVLPEGEDLRVLEAAHLINKDKIAKIIILGNKEEIENQFSKNQWNIQGIEVINPQNSPELPKLTELLYNLRKEKGMTLEEAQKTAKISNYFGTLMMKAGLVDGLVSGANHSTADTVRPALQIIKSKPGHIVSSAFIMANQDGEKYIFSDCAINIEPTPAELCDIAIESALMAIKLDIEPKIALLSYSTYGSGKGEQPEKARETLELVKKTISADEYKNLNIKVDGELQVDAALDHTVGKLKAPTSTVAGEAKVLIFPNLAAGNIAYKLLQRLGHCEAYGPVLLGLKAPINDLSRGCSVDDIIGTVALTAIQVNN